MPKNNTAISAEVLFDEARANGFKGVDARRIQAMTSPELLKLQSHLGLGSEWGTLVFPETWMPNGGMKQLSVRRIDLRTPLKDYFAGEADEELAIRTVVAAVLLCLATPVYNPRYIQYLKPSSVCTNSRSLLELACHATLLPARVDGKLFARLPPPGRDKTEKGKRWRIELERFSHFAAVGLWNDIAEKDSVPPPPPPPAGDPIPVPETPKNRTYLPLRDEFLAEAGHRIVWLVETLGPALLICGKEIRDIRMANPLSEGVRSTNASRRTELSQDFLKNFHWKDPQGSPILTVPFSMDFSGMGKGGKFIWPPRTMAQVRMLLRILQSAHLFICLLSTGGRISEMLSLGPGCLTESPDGIPLANGRTYKLSLRAEGKERDWPLPSIAMQAIKQQNELAALAIPDSDEDDDFDFLATNRIWTREGGSGEGIDGEYNKYLSNIVKIFGLTEQFGDGNMHAHRFRKSTARLIALSIVGAPKILMDLFGHKQIGMTLHYILSDPTIRAEMLEVARAQTIMLAKNAIESAEDCGGPAAEKLKAAVIEERFRMGSDFGEDSMESLAETLTINGRHWQLVRPGVLCTKGPQVAGACTPSTAMPEPSRCRTHCDHRLELGFLKSDVNELLVFAVKQLEQATSEGDEVKIEMWSGQILTNIDRFIDLKVKWKSHVLVKNLLRNRRGVEAA